VPTRGLVCLANDHVYDFLVALAESVRRHSDLPLAIVPFDDELRRTRRLADRLGLEIVETPDYAELDALGARFWPDRTRAPHTFRKLAAFWRTYDELFFVDADVVLLRDPAPLFAAHAERAPDAVWAFDTGEGMAYPPGPRREEMLRAGFPGISTGLLIARRGVITLEQVHRAAERALPLRDQFLDVAEQPFLNFLLETEGIPVAKAGDVLDDVAGTTWAQAHLARRDGTWVIDEPSWPDHGRAPAALHWSGSTPSPLMPNRSLFVDYRSGGGGLLRRAATTVRLAALAAARFPGRARSLLNVVRGRPLGAWR
jgi:hypothetical protein